MKSKDIRLNQLSDFYCTCCGHKGIPIIRKSGKNKEPGHLKKLYCLYCGEERNMVEVKQSGKYTLEDFEIEFKGGNFVNGERKVKSYKQFIAEYRHKTESELNVYDNGIRGRA